MNARKYILRFYRLALHMYPKDFRAAYGDEMLMAAYDMLQLRHTVKDTLAMAFRLGEDVFLSATKERALQAAGTMRDKKQAGRTAWTVLQALAMLGVTYLLAAPIVMMYTLLRHMPGAQLWYLEVMTAAIPAGMVLLAFLLLRQASGVALWRKLKWSYLLGVAGALTYIALLVLDRQIASPIFPQTLHLWPGKLIVYTYGRDWILAAMTYIGLYAITVTIRGRLRVPKKI